MFEQKLKKVQIVNNIQFYNPTMEMAKVYYNNRHYFMKPLSYTNVPADGAEQVYREWSDWGVFPVFEGEDFEMNKRQALITYMKKCLDVRIKNWHSALDGQKKAGMTITEDPRGLKALKQWKEEILKMLEMDKPVDVIPSFFNNDLKSVKTDSIAEPNKVGRPKMNKEIPTELTID